MKFSKFTIELIKFIILFFSPLFLYFLLIVPFVRISFIDDESSFISYNSFLVSENKNFHYLIQLCNDLNSKMYNDTCFYNDEFIEDIELLKKHLFIKQNNLINN